MLDALIQLQNGGDNKFSLSFLKRSKKWQIAIKSQKDRRLWEVAVLFHMRDAFRSGDIWLANSRRFGDWKQSLVPLHAVHTTPKIAVPYSPDEWLAEQSNRLSAAFTQLARTHRQNQLLDGITESGELKIKQPEEHTHEDAGQLISDLYKRLPEIRITDILLEVDQDVGFTDSFRNLRTGAPCKDKIGLLNVLLSEGLNLGLSKMAASQ